MTEPQSHQLAAEIAEILISRLPALETLDELAKSAGRVARDGSGIRFELSDIVPLEELETAYIHFVLESVDWNKTRAAELLGINASTLYRKLERWEEDKPPNDRC